MITKTDRKLLFILCIAVVVLILAKCMTSEGYTVKTEGIKFKWRNKTLNDVTKWTIKLTGADDSGNLSLLETKVIKKEDNPEYFKPFKSSEVTFQARDFTIYTIKKGLQVDLYYNEETDPLITKKIYLTKNMFSITLDLLTIIKEKLFVFNNADYDFSDGYVTIKSKTSTKKFVINDNNEFEFSDKTYDNKECYDIFYLHKYQSWSNEFYLRSANNNKWTKTFWRKYSWRDFTYGADKIKYAKVWASKRSDREEKEYSTKRRFYKETNPDPNEKYGYKDKFEVTNTEDGSWRDNARKYIMKDNYLYRIDYDGEEGETKTKISDEEIVMESVTNTCTATELGKDKGTEFKKTVAWKPISDNERWNTFRIHRGTTHPSGKTCVSRFKEDVKKEAEDRNVRVNDGDTRDEMCKKIFIANPGYTKYTQGENGLDLPEWGTGCRDKGNYDRKGVSSGCEGKFSTADIYSSPPFRHLLKEYRMKEKCWGNPNLGEDIADDCFWYMWEEGGVQGEHSFKYGPRGRDNPGGYEGRVCPKGDDVKALKDAIDNQCKAITEKELCLAEKKNETTSGKIKTIKDDFDLSKTHAGRAAQSHRPTYDVFNNWGDTSLKAQLPDFDKNFEGSICNWRGSATKPVVEIDPRAGTLEDKKRCEPKTKDDLALDLKGTKWENEYAGTDYANYTVNPNAKPVIVRSSFGSEINNTFDSVLKLISNDDCEDNEKVGDPKRCPNLCELRNENNCLNLNNTNLWDKYHSDGHFFQHNTFQDYSGTKLTKQVCKLNQYGWDEDGKEYNHTEYLAEQEAKRKADLKAAQVEANESG